MPPQGELKVVIIRYMKKYKINHSEAVNKIRIELIRIMAHVDENPRPWHNGL
jgi:hypothetical protein